MYDAHVRFSVMLIPRYLKLFTCSSSAPPNVDRFFFFFLLVLCTSLRDCQSPFFIVDMLQMTRDRRISTTFYVPTNSLLFCPSLKMSRKKSTNVNCNFSSGIVRMLLCDMDSRLYYFAFEHKHSKKYTVNCQRTRTILTHITPHSLSGTQEGSVAAEAKRENCFRFCDERP